MNISATTKVLAVILLLIGTAWSQEAPSVPSPLRPGVPRKEIPAPLSGWTPVIRVEPFAKPNYSPYSPGESFERSITVDPRVNVSLCVTQGNVKINGWSRNEIRVFVKDGSKVGFTVQEKNVKSGLPVWVKIGGLDPGKSATPLECLWGNQVELDVPTGSVINMEGKATRTTVDSVRKISIKNAGGDISLRNITDGVDATTFQGDLDIENSEGAITLNTTSGNILAFESGPSEVGDIFKARTNSGRISVQNVQHRQIDVNSISGSVMFSGGLLNGGVYDLKTINGSLTLNLPPNSPCFVSATYMEGNFNSDVPLKLITDNISPGPIRSIKGSLGSGDCKLILSNSSGSIRIKKQ